MHQPHWPPESTIELCTAAYQRGVVCVTQNKDVVSTPEGVGEDLLGLQVNFATSLRSLAIDGAINLCNNGDSNI